jgi:hypothetical protein
LLHTVTAVFAIAFAFGQGTGRGKQIAQTKNSYILFHFYSRRSVVAACDK